MIRKQRLVYNPNLYTIWKHTKNVPVDTSANNTACFTPQAWLQQLEINVSFSCNMKRFWKSPLTFLQEEKAGQTYNRWLILHLSET